MVLQAFSRLRHPSSHFSSSCSSLPFPLAAHFAAVLLVFVACSSTNTIVAAQQQQQHADGFVGLAGDNLTDLVIRAPAGGSVVVDGVRVRELEAQHAADLQALEVKHARQLQSLRDEHRADSKLLRRALCKAGVAEAASVAQVVPTVGAQGMTHFSIDGEDYIIVANYYDGSSNIINSVLYRYSNVTEQFETHQTIPNAKARGVRDWEYFEVLPGVHCLVAAVFLVAGSGYTTNSPVFVWDRDARVLRLNFTIPTIGARDWEHFEVEGVHYTAVANNYNIPSNGGCRQKSAIYRWETEGGLGVSKLQDVNTLCAMTWEHFTIPSSGGDDHYLAVANSADNTDVFTTSSKILKRNTVSGLFEDFQTITTMGAADWESFSIDGAYYLGLCNRRADTTVASFSTTSSVLKWTGTQFVEVQKIHTLGCHDMTHFQVNGNHYMAVANNRGTGTNEFNIVSYVYEWNRSTQSFKIDDPLLAIDTRGAIAWLHHERDGEHYLTVSEYFDSVQNKYDLSSAMYQWNGLCP